MPNWCENVLTLEGEKAEIERFIAANSDPFSTEDDARLLSFEMAIPTPEKKEGDPNDYWYHHHTNNWGTKWDASDVMDWEIMEYGQKVAAHCMFNTAWSPPLAWLATVGASFPSLMLQLDYVEHGNALCGSAVVSDGDFFDEEKTYDRADYGFEDYEEDEEEEEG